MAAKTLGASVLISTTPANPSTVGNGIFTLLGSVIKRP